MGFTRHAYPGDATLVILEKSLGRTGSAPAAAFPA
jgi:hypothetical protein